MSFVRSWKALFFYAFGDEDKAASEFKKCLEVDPSNAPNLISLGKILVGRGRYYEGLGRFDLALKHMRPNDRSLPEVFAYIAHCYHKLGSFDLSVPFYSKAIDTWEKDGAFKKKDVIYGLGRIYLKQKKYEEAIKVLKEGVSSQNDEPLIHLGLGIAYYEMGQKEEGKYHLDIAHTLNPQLNNDETVKEMMKELERTISIH
jgi:tetratricopeptide (TPR) repeat protein